MKRKFTFLILALLALMTSPGWGQSTYTKVTSTSDFTDGQYLIVYETGNVALNGALSSIDEASNTVTVSISNGSIAGNTTIDAAAFTVTHSTDGYSFLGSNNLYICHSGSKNTLNTSESVQWQTVSFNNGDAVISGGGNYTLRYNSTSGQTRFRYYASGQQAIQLYKKQGTPSATLQSIEVTAAPTKVVYTEGEYFDPTGLVIRKYFDDETTSDLAYDGNGTAFSFNPTLTTPLATNNAQVAITVGGKSVNQAITVNAAPKYTITFMDRTNQVHQRQIIQGAAVGELPEDPDDIGTYKFQGWAVQFEGTQQTAPEMISSTTIPTGSTTYYAVYAEEESGDVESKSICYDHDGTHTGWTLTGGTDKTSYVVLNTGASIASPSIQFNSITSIVINARTFGGANYKTVNVYFGGAIIGSITAENATLTDHTISDISTTNGEGAFTFSSSTTSTANGPGVAVITINYEQGEIAISNYTQNPVAKTLVSIEVSGTPAEFWKGDAFNHNGMTVTANWDDESQTDVTSDCEFSTPDMATAGEQTVTVTYEGKTATYSITVKTIANTQETAYTIAQAIDIIEAGKDLQSSVYVAGIISQIDEFNSQYHNMTYWIEDESTETEFEVYRGKNLNNTDFNDENDIVIRANVIIYGKITKYNSTYEFSQGNYLVSYTAPQSYGITLNQSIGGTISADKETAAAGETVTITIEPASGYTLANLTGATFNETVDPELLTYTFTMPAEEVTISATFNAVPTYTISFTTNSVAETATIVINQGDAIGTLPEPTAANIPNGYTFRGWSAGDVALTDVEPTYVTAETIPTGDMTLKAVFAMGETSGENALVKMVAGNTLNNGDKIVIVAHETTVALYQETVSSSYVNIYTFDNNFATIMGNDKNWLTVSTAEGGFTLGDATNGYLYSSENNLYIGNTAQTWTLSDLADGTFKIQRDERNLSYRSDLNSYKYWRMGGTSYGTSGQTVLDIYKISTSSTTYSNFCTSVTALSGNLAAATTVANTAYYIREAANVPADATATINGVLGNADASLLIINDGGQLICNNKVAATVKKSISAINGSNGWYTIASPLTSTTIANTGALNGNYDLYTYDEEYYTWRNYEVVENQTTYDWFKNGKGYLYANRTLTDIEFAGTLRAGNEVVEVDLSYESTYQKLKGFNLVGNPFAHNIIMGTDVKQSNSNTVYYVVEHGANLVAKTSETPIKPCQGFMVQADAEEQSITFNPSSSAKETQTEHEYITIAAGNGDFMDMAYICTNADEKLGKITLDNPTAKVYLQQNGNDYAIAPLGEATSMVVCFKAPQSGTYTINVSSDVEGVSLKDMKTGYVTAINHSASYTFEASENDAESRFKIMFGTTGVEENGAQMFVFQSGSNLIISGEGTVQIIDMMGRVLRTAQVESNATVSTEGLTAGAYVVRMLTAGGVQTQKVIVK